MKIVRLRPLTGPFAGVGSIKFGPGVNIIRGANGIGKTAILEHASLLGHISVMRVAKPHGKARLEMQVRLSKADTGFLTALNGAFDTDHSVFAKALKGINYSLEALRAAPIPQGEFTLLFKYPSQSVPDDQLKSVLADEARIRELVEVFSPDIDVRIAQALVLWSRPNCLGDKEDGPWSVTPRYVDGLSAPCHQLSQMPSSVFYINTDMYEFGAGLDIRESPKHLKTKITSVLVDRLQLVQADRVPESGVSLRTAITDDDGHPLKCEGKIKESWSQVFGPEHEFRLGELRCATGETTQSDRTYNWTFMIGGRESSEFVSSGENQALFVLAMVCGVGTEGSCMLFDEPELHLTFSAGSKLMEQIRWRTKDTRSQAIIVTHLPHLYRGDVKPLRAAWRRERLGFYDYNAIHMIYIDRSASGITIKYDHQAVNDASRASHEDVMKLIEGLDLGYEIPIFPMFTAKWWSKRTSPRRLPGWRRRARRLVRACAARRSRS